MYVVDVVVVVVFVVSAESRLFSNAARSSSRTVTVDSSILLSCSRSYSSLLGEKLGMDVVLDVPAVVVVVA